MTRPIQSSRRQVGPYWWSARPQAAGEGGVHATGAYAGRGHLGQEASRGAEQPLQSWQLAGEPSPPHGCASVQQQKPPLGTGTGARACSCCRPSGTPLDGWWMERYSKEEDGWRLKKNLTTRAHTSLSGESVKQ